MKKLLTVLALSIMLVASCVGLIACGDNEVDTRDPQIVKVYKLYADNAVANGEVPLSYEEWLFSIRGEDGNDGIGISGMEKTSTDGLVDTYVITFTDGNTFTFNITNGARGEDGSNGTNGTNGADGVTPQIRINEVTDIWEVSYDKGITWISLGVKATGSSGNNGNNGADGKSAYEIWLDNGHVGDESAFLEWIKGQDGTSGQNGITPLLRINETTNEWEVSYDNGVSYTSLGVKATGNAGSNGSNGTNGQNGINGKSAYEIWLDNGHTGSETDFLNWLKGDGEDDNPQGLDFYPLPDGTYAVEVGKAKYLESIVIPSTYKGKVVTLIGDSAFDDCVSLTRVTIGNSVTSIGSYAFSGCKSLTSVTIGNSVTSIGELAFFNCNSLTRVTIGNSVTSIGSYAFGHCYSLASITIPDGVTSIGSYAFQSCHSLTSVTIPDSVTSIGSYAFESCHSLTSVNASENNTAYKSIDGNLYSKDGKTLIQYAIGKTATEFSIPDSVTSIGDGAFEFCRSLTSITIPDSVTSIGQSAFKGCSKLTSVTIGNSVTSIERSVFWDCSSLAKVYYGGTAEEWSQVNIEGYDPGLTSATKYYYSESQPTETGNYWHYVNGVVTEW